MSKRLCLISVAVLASAALAALPAVAQAIERHWYKGLLELPKGGPHTVIKTKGTFVIKFTAGPAAGKQVKCKVKDLGEIWNPGPVGTGEDQMNVITFAMCKATPGMCIPPNALFVKALGLPWHSFLYDKPPKEGDDFEGVQIEVGCKGVAIFAKLEGELAGGVVPGLASLEGGLEEPSSGTEAEATLIDTLKAAGPGKVHIGP